METPIWNFHAPYEIRLKIPLSEISMSRRLCILEVYFRAIEGALEQLRHLFRRDASRVGTRAGVADGVCRNRVQFLKELVFLHAEFLNRARCT